MPNICFWRGAVGDTSFLETYQKSINKLLTGTFAPINLEKLTGHDVYSYRVSVVARLLFTTINVGGQPYLLVLEFLPTHNYQNSRFLRSGVLQRYIDKNEAVLAKAIVSNEFIPIERVPDWLSQIASIPNDCEPIALDYFNQQFISLSDNQELALRMPLPAVIDGAAGSGKSCVSMLLLSEHIAAWQKKDAADKHSILYVSHSKPLVRAMETMWRESPLAEDIPPEMVRFKSYEELLAEHADWVGKMIMGDKDENKANFDAWYKGYVKQSQRVARTQKTASKDTDIIEIDSETVYQEFRICSAYKEDEYCELGQRQSSLSLQEQKTWLYAAYKAYQEYLKHNKLIHPAFHSIELSNLFNFVVVDESQDFSHLQLKMLSKSAINGAIVYCIDSHQSLSDVQSLNLNIFWYEGSLIRMKQQPFCRIFARMVPELGMFSCSVRRSFVIMHGLNIKHKEQSLLW